MRIILVIMMLIFLVSVKAQTALPEGYGNHSQPRSIADKGRHPDSTSERKWFINKYIGVSSGFAFFDGSHATMLTIPVGVQINHKLNNNWYAFAGISAAPGYVYFNHSFLSTNTNKLSQNNNFFKSNGTNMYSKAEMGLMYINEQKTFSISGSIGMERSSYPLIPITQAGILQPNTFISPTW